MDQDSGCGFVRGGGVAVVDAGGGWGPVHPDPVDDGAGWLRRPPNGPTNTVTPAPVAPPANTVTAATVTPGTVAAAAVTPATSALPNTASSPSTVAAASTTPAASTSSLPFTGADIEELAGLGIAAVLVGGVMLRRRRRSAV